MNKDSKNQEKLSLIQDFLSLSLSLFLSLSPQILC